MQSWDTANKATELSDLSVCTTWGIKGKKLCLLRVLRKRLEYPDLKGSLQRRVMRTFYCTSPSRRFQRAIREVEGIPDRVVPIRDRAASTPV